MLTNLWLKAGATFDYIYKFMVPVLGVILIFVGFSVCASVFTRNLINKPLIWVVGVTEYTLATVAFLGAAWLLRGEGHVNIDIAVNLLKPKANDAVNAMTSLLGAMLCLIVCWSSTAASLDHFRRGVLTMSAIPFPLGPLLLIQALSLFLLFIQFLRRFYKHLKSWTTAGKKEERTLEIPGEF